MSNKQFQNETKTLQAQLAEAVGLIEKSADLAGELGDYLVSRAKRYSGTELLLDHERYLRTFLARHAQAEQQEAPNEDDERKAKPGLYCRDCGTRLMVKGVCSIYCPNKNCGDTKIEQQEALAGEGGEV